MMDDKITRAMREAGVEAFYDWAEAGDSHEATMVVVAKVFEAMDAVRKKEEQPLTAQRI